MAVKSTSSQKQLRFLPKQDQAYGGRYANTRKGRSYGRPLDTKNTMHLVLRSSQAVGEKSFRRTENEKRINKIIQKFSEKFGVKILSMANVGNHLHLHIKLSHRRGYFKFIRATTSAIAMAITKKSRWNAPAENQSNGTKKQKFWDLRPFSRIVIGIKYFLNLKDYIQINRVEGYGYKKNTARMIYAMNIKTLDPT